MAANLSAYARVRSQQNSNTKRHHITASFGGMEARFNSNDPLDQGATIVRRLMPLIDAEAGYITYHPYRIAKEYRGDVYGHESGDGDMTPADVLELVASESWSWEAIEDEYLTFAPHFHIVCVSTFAQCGAITKGIYERTGIVTHRITQGDSSVSIWGENDMAAVLAYNLSHCGLIKDENGRIRPPTRSFGPVETLDTTPAEDAVTAAVRSVSRGVVGLSLPTGKCGAPVPKTATPTTASTATAASDGGGDSDLPAFVLEQLPDADAGSGGGGSTPTPVASPTPISKQLERAELEDADSENTARCGATLRRIYQAPEYLDLDAEEWDVPASRREQVIEGIEEMRSIVREAGRDLDPAEVIPPAPTPTNAD